MYAKCNGVGVRGSVRGMNLPRGYGSLLAVSLTLTHWGCGGSRRGPESTASPSGAGEESGTGAGAQAAGSGDTLAPCPAGFPATPEGQPPGGHCDLSRVCAVPGGYCACDGYHGGIPPEPHVDYTHWICARTSHRRDGCPGPDELKDGAPCSPERKACLEAEGLFCGQFFTCTGGHWNGNRNTCAEIP